MDLTDDQQLSLWQAAIESALGPLSAYLTPENYGLSAMSLAGGLGEQDAFRAEIQRRIDLARALKVAEIIESIGSELPHTYRHSVRYTEERLDGVLMVPRLIRERAAGRLNRIPVLRAERFIETPEALLASESLRLAGRIAWAWSGVGGAESKLAKGLSSAIARFEARQPWSALRNRPRPALRALASSVKNRTIAGRNPLGGEFDRLSDLVLTGSEAVTSAAGPISFLMSHDPRFEDRLFELVCLGWLLAGLRRAMPSGSVLPAGLRASEGPIFVGSMAGAEIRLFYQAGFVGEHARYRWRNGAKLRAIPDYVLQVRASGVTRIYLLDAKNRGQSSTSEIVYKLLGYRENLGLSPYLAIGLAPTFGRRGELNGVEHSDRAATVVRLPLSRGRQLIERALPIWLASALR